jgi:hypothetical protein
MDPALAEINARLDEIERQLEFIALSVKLRPRLHSLLRWEVGGEEIELARKFMDQKGVTEEGVYGALLVRALGSLERFIRKSIASAVVRKTSSATTYDDLPPAIQTMNLVLTGRLLSNIYSPSDHIPYNPADLVSSLSSCQTGNTAFELNTVAFEATVTGASPDSIERSLKHIGHDQWWDKIGSTENMETILQCIGSGPRETGKTAREHLKELWKWRNRLAHCGDQEPSVDVERLRTEISFIRCLSMGINGVVA